MNGGQSSFWVEEHHGTNDDDDFNFTPFCPTPKRRPSKKMKMEFTGWGSTLLIRFLQSLGQDTTNKISQFDVSSIINNYVNANRLLHPTKKKRIVCDTNLFTLFGKKTIARIKVYDLLEPHFAENREGSSSDDLGLGDDDDLLNFSDDENKENGNHKKEAPPKTEAPPKKRKGFAAIIPENIRLLYLKKSLIEELLLKDQLPTLEAKMVGSFVRIKNDPHDYLQKSSHQLLQVTGVKEITENDNSSPKVVFQVSNYFKDIPISIISDDDFTEKECESLHQKVKDGLLKKPTIVEFEEKVQALHEDITKHWLVREIDLLQKLINRANEKGWRKELFEYMERRQLLQKPEEQSRLLREIPIVLAEEVKKVEPELLNLPDVEQQGSGDSPAPILRGASETPTSNKKANNSQFWIPCVPNIAASTPSTFIRRLQEDEKQGKVGLSVSIPEGASGIPICDDVAKGNSSRVSAMEVSAENRDIPIQATENIQASIRNENNGTTLSVNLENHAIPIQEPENIQAPISNKNNGLMLSLNMENQNVPIQAPENIQAPISSKNNGMILSLNLENQNVPIQAPENIQPTTKNENNGPMLSLNLNLGTPPARVVIELSDDDEEETDDPVVLNPPLMEDIQCLDWHYADPQGDVQGPFSLGQLKRWWDADYFPLDFKVWKGRNQAEAVYLIDIIRTAFPKQP